MTRVGRNDPCPCGSGRKYKKCCLRQEEPARAGEGLGQAAPPERVGQGIEALAAGSGDVGSPGSPVPLRKRLSRSLRNAFAPVLPRAREAAECDAHLPEVQAVQEQLQAHREEYGRLLQRPAQLLRRTEALLAEPAFEGMRFTTADLERAFRKVGYPPEEGQEGGFPGYVVRVLGVLVDRKARLRLARRLQCLVPYYVARGRHLDAWIVQHNGMQIVHPPEGGCGPFLLSMFMRALDAWDKERDREEAALLRDLGVDVAALQGMTIEEVDAHLTERVVDGKVAAKFERLLDAHPHLRAQMEERCRDTEHAAVDLLQREEGRCLMLGRKEVEPWLGMFTERIAARPEFAASALSGRKPSKKLTVAFGECLYQVAGEMARGVFTGDRLRRLASDIHACRAGLPPGDEEGIKGVVGALAAAKASPDPGKSHFLTMLCLQSLLEVVQGTGSRRDT